MVAATTSPIERRRSRRQADHRSSRGFTLVEIIVVIVILAVSATIVIPAVQAGRNQREVRRTLQAFVAAIREASSRSILRRRSVELWLSPSEHAYAFALPSRSGADAEALDREPDPLRDQLEEEEDREIVGRVELPESVSFGEIRGGRWLRREIVAFPFYPTGASSGGEVEIVFEYGKARQEFVITIDPLISSVDLKERS